MKCVIKILCLGALLLVTSCNKRPDRVFSHSNEGADEEKAKPGKTTKPVYPEEEDLNLALDPTIMIGSYLKKELGSPENASKVITVFVQIRQENNISKNFDTLKSSLKTKSPAIEAAIEQARKAGLTTVEFPIEVSALQTLLGLINNAVSSIEISQVTPG